MWQKIFFAILTVILVAATTQAKSETEYDIYFCNMLETVTSKELQHSLANTIDVNKFIDLSKPDQEVALVTNHKRIYLFLGNENSLESFEPCLMYTETDFPNWGEIVERTLLNLGTIPEFLILQNPNFSYKPSYAQGKSRCINGHRYVSSMYLKKYENSLKEHEDILKEDEYLKNEIANSLKEIIPYICRARF